MKPLTQFLIILIVITLLLGGGFYVYSNQEREALPVFAATVRSDCAPWDGSAFTVSIPMDEGVIEISIYQLPDLHRPKRFSFPDTTGNISNALLLLPVGAPEQLIGKVLFQRVIQDSPVEGAFDFSTETGRQLNGKFVADWENQPVLCG